MKKQIIKTAESYETKSFAAINKNENMRMNSSSGGVFFSIAKYTISKGGIVFGAAFDLDGQVRHKPCTDLETIKELMQSKYVESDMGDTYKTIRDELSRGRLVYFTGTPCQVYGLLSFLKESGVNLNTSQIITTDFICHGVPSRMVWRRYLNEISAGRTHVNISFRDKSKGWVDYNLRVQYDDGSEYCCSRYKDPYMQGFIKNLYLRESCHECKFRGVDRNSDFTIADFWKVQNYLPNMYDNKGTSVILAHNNRAVKILEDLSSELELREIDNEIVIHTNTPLVQSVIKHPKRDRFFSSISDREKIGTQIKRFTKVSFARRIFRKIKSVVKR